MKNKSFPFLSLALSGCLVISCSSAVSLADVQKQEEKATKALNEAQEKLVALAEVKEEYSKSGVQARIAAIKKEQKEIQDDMNVLGELETSAAEDDTKKAIKNLKAKNKALADKIKTLEALPTEDWSETVTQINNQIAALRQEVAKITANLK
jgi:cytochrome c556